MIRCPICKKEVTPGAVDFPFCSERCRIIDLGNWAAEKYVVSSPAKPEASHDDEDSQSGDT